MINKIKKIILIPTQFYSYYKSEKMNPLRKWMKKEIEFFKANTILNTEGILLTQKVNDHEYTIKLAAASKSLAEKNNLKVYYYNVLIDDFDNNRIKKIYYYFFKGYNNKIYESFCQSQIFSNNEKYEDENLIDKKLKEILLEINNNGIDFINQITIDNILVGDLIYDTYLRFYNKPTIEKITNELENTIKVCLNVFYCFKAMLKKNKIKAIVNTYSSYIHHGIPARLGLANNIPVYTLGSNSYIIQKLSKEFPYHSINHTLFDNEKNVGEENLRKAENNFTKRFEGEIDNAVSYMRSSSFQKKPIDEKLALAFKAKKRNIILYTHDFYDSPHVNRQLLFPDLYQFLKQTLCAINEIEDTNVFIKIHPNGIGDCKEITIQLVESFKNENFKIIDESVSNLNIIELKPDLVITARGTIALEMAYFNIPVVALFDNTYSNFNFAHICYSISEFNNIILGKIKPSINFDKQNIYNFYYQAYLEQLLPEYEKLNKILTSYKGDAYNDNYINYLQQNLFFENKETFLENYTIKINECN